MIDPTDLLHLSPAPHFKTIYWPLKFQLSLYVPARITLNYCIHNSTHTVFLRFSYGLSDQTAITASYRSLHRITRNILKTVNKKNAGTCSLDIYITISHITLLHVSALKWRSSGNQTKVMRHKAKLATSVHGWYDARNANQHSTALTFVWYVGCFQDTLYQVSSHLCKYRTNKWLHFSHLTLLDHVNCV